MTSIENHRLLIGGERLAPQAGEPPTFYIELADWIWHPNYADRPHAVAFLCDFETGSDPLGFHISADQRYTVYIDGEEIGRGPDAGNPKLWYFSSYEVSLKPGKHTMLVHAWWAGDHAPLARMTLQPGFILYADAPYTDQLSTHKAHWSVKELTSRLFDLYDDSPQAQFLGKPVTIDLNRPKDVWHDAVVVAPGNPESSWGEVSKNWQLCPTPLPEQAAEIHSLGHVIATRRKDPDGFAKRPVQDKDLSKETLGQWQLLVDGEENFSVDSGQIATVLVDLGTYLCGYAQLKISGGKGASIRWKWAEALIKRLGNPKDKGNRGRTRGKFFTGFGDTFIGDGSEEQYFESLWWRAGRYIELHIQTQGAPLTIEEVSIRRTGYPLQKESEFKIEGLSTEKIEDLCLLTLQSCAHDTFMDCPHYEQLMSTGNTRLEALMTYTLSRDCELPRMALAQFNSSRLEVGDFTSARFPCREPQIIPGFSLIWVWMLHDFMYWRDDLGFVEEQITCMRSILAEFKKFENSAGLLVGLPGWKYLDAIPEWNQGVPPDKWPGPQATMNLLYLLTLEKAEELEKVCGNLGMADEVREKMGQLGETIMRVFWRPDFDLLSDSADPRQDCFSQHAQILGQLAGIFSHPQAAANFNRVLDDRPKLNKASHYFSHYLLETYNLWHRPDLILNKLADWEAMSKTGLLTTPEHPEPTRSDCHGWSAHPLFHLHASLMGIRPGCAGFQMVEIVPKLSHFKKMSAKIPHPKGFVEAAVDTTSERALIHVKLPEETYGTLVWEDDILTLKPGTNDFELERVVNSRSSALC